MTIIKIVSRIRVSSKINRLADFHISDFPIL